MTERTTLLSVPILLDQNSIPWNPSPVNSSGKKSYASPMPNPMASATSRIPRIVSVITASRSIPKSSLP